MNNKEISENIGKEIIYNGRRYILNAYILRYHQGKRIRQCEIRDNKANSIMIVNPDLMEVIECDKD